MRLRAATLADAEQVLAVETEAFAADAWSLAAVRSELAAAARCVMVAEDADGVLGWAVLLESDDCDLLRLAVRPTARRRGVGRALLAAVTTRAGERPVLLEVAADNAAALGLYAAAGFVEISRRAGYYGAGRDALVLRRPVYGVPRA